MEVNPEFRALPEDDVSNEPFCYMIEFYMDEYIVLAMGRRQARLCHIATVVMKGIHDAFPPYGKDDDDPIFIKKVL